MLLLLRKTRKLFGEERKLLLLTEAGRCHC
jgi:hypothetical protein